MNPGRVMLLAVVLAVLASVSGDAAQENEPRNWHLSLHWVAAERNSYDVFGNSSIRIGTAVESGSGLGLSLGRRFGGRFILGLHIYGNVHDVVDPDQQMLDVEFLVTGTVLFCQRATLQPFLRGGIGGTVLVLDDTSSLGTSAVFGGGLQVRLSQGLCFEIEAVATFADYINGRTTISGAEDLTWDLRESATGWRTGAGFVIWF